MNPAKHEAVLLKKIRRAKRRIFFIFFIKNTLTRGVNDVSIPAKVLFVNEAIGTRKRQNYHLFTS